MKNTFKRLMALLMAVMMLSAFALTVAAEEGEGTQDLSVVNFTKTLSKEKNAYAPNTTYTFTITAGTAVNAGEGQDAVYAGALDEVAFVAGDNQALDAASDDILTVTSAPVAEDIGKLELSYNCQIKIDVSKYEDPGIYRYVIKETKGDYKGLTYDETTRTLDVYIVTDDNNEMSILGTLMYDTTDSTSKDKAFANDYDTADLTVSKAVTGNQGDRNKTFDITVEITGVAGEQYYILKGTDAKTITAGEDGKISATYALADGESFTVYGLSEGDSYTVTEADYSADGYTTTIEANDEDTNTGSIAAAAQGEEVVDADVVVTNEKDVTVPTGIVLSVLPFVAMLLIAAVVAVFFFQKRERREA